MNWSSLKYDRGLDKNPPADFDMSHEQAGIPNGKYRGELLSFRRPL